MSEPFERLKLAREKAGYDSAEDAAKAMGVKPPTYHHHENGTNGLSRAGARYARFYRINLEWLLTGRGPMKLSDREAIPVNGDVRAGQKVKLEAAAKQEQDFILLPGDGKLGALKVTGDSMYPRFYEGEYILYNSQPVPPTQLLNQYAIVQTLNGETFIKILREGRSPSHFTLESHNHAPIRDVELLCAYEFVGVLPHKDLVLPKKKKRG